jgi:hypothetical protein
MDMVENGVRRKDKASNMRFSSRGKPAAPTESLDWKYRK